MSRGLASLNSELIARPEVSARHTITVIVATNTEKGRGLRCFTPCHSRHAYGSGLKPLLVEVLCIQGQAEQASH